MLLVRHTVTLSNTLLALFFLSSTIIPFGMVMAGGFSRGLLVTVIAITAVAQVLVQLVYFTHEYII